MKAEPRAVIHRVVDSLWQVMLITLASITSYSIAFLGFGHPVPLLAVTVAISSLGFARDTRPGRVATTALAMIIGVALSEVFLLTLGPGVWQLGVVISLALLIARVISPNPAFAITVAIQAVLVQLLTAPTGGVFARVIDGIIGALVALLVTALAPRNPIRLIRRDSRALFVVFKNTLAQLRTVLISGDGQAADDALAQIRQTQPLIDNWKSSLESAQAISRVSPFYRWAQKQMRDQRILLRGMDLATRNLRVVTRRIDFLMEDKRSRRELAELVTRFIAAVDLLEQSIDDFSIRAKAQKYLRKLLRELDPNSPGLELTLGDKVVLMQLRPMAVDLAMAAGMPGEVARGLLPKVD